MSTCHLPHRLSAVSPTGIAASLTRPLSPPATNPFDTEKLWNCVRERKTSQLPRVAGRASRRGRLPLEDSRDRSASPPSISPAVASSLRVPELVLQACRIDVDKTKRTTPSAFAHFGTSGTSDTLDTPPDYRQFPRLAHVDVWLEDDTQGFQGITEEYREMRLQGHCETEFAAFAQEFFFKGQPRAARATEDSLLRTQRMIQPVSLPGNTWKALPVLLPQEGAALGASWAGDVRPDCSYWLSLRGFNGIYSCRVQQATYVNSNSLCPYLTVEFKRDGEPEDVAIAHVAVAGAIALYNRFRLRRSATAFKSHRWAPAPVGGLYHYAITFAGSQYAIWILRARVDDSTEWDGCVMELLVTADCSQHWIVARELARWINEIHRWGLLVHGSECMGEIDAVLRGKGV